MKFLSWFVAMGLAALALVSAPATAAPGAFTVQKEKISTGDCHGAIIPNQPNPNICDFVIIVRNVGTQPYSGPMTVSDQLYENGQPVPGAPTVVSSGNGWTCSVPTGFNNTAVHCDHPNINLQPGQTTIFPLTLEIISGPPVDANCARVIMPQVNNLSTGCVIMNAPSAQIEVTKSFPHNTTPAGFSGTFQVSMQCSLPVPYQVFFTLPVTGTNSPPVMVGSTCTITELPPTAALAAGCSWGSPSYPMGNTVNVTSAGPFAPIRVYNPFSCALTPGPVINPGPAIPVQRGGKGRTKAKSDKASKREQ